MASMFAKRCLNILLPAHCISCGVIVEENASLCGQCWSDIDFIGKPHCARCGFPLEVGATEGSICGNCIINEPLYDKGLSVCYYNHNSRPMILDYKYGDKIHATQRFAGWMINIAGDILPEIDVIIPVPLHWRRLFARRYNQAALIAQAISQRTNIPILSSTLQRNKHNPPQAGLPRRQRLNNVKGAFIVPSKSRSQMKEKNILLIDDVMTTGATLNECTKALKKAGVDKVFVLTLARTIDGR